MRADRGDDHVQCQVESEVGAGLAAPLTACASEKRQNKKEKESQKNENKKSSKKEKNDEFRELRQDPQRLRPVKGNTKSREFSRLSGSRLASWLTVLCFCWLSLSASAASTSTTSLWENLASTKSRCTGPAPRAPCSFLVETAYPCRCGSNVVSAEQHAEWCNASSPAAAAASHGVSVDVVACGELQLSEPGIALVVLVSWPQLGVEFSLVSGQRLASLFAICRGLVYQVWLFWDSLISEPLGALYWWLFMGLVAVVWNPKGPDDSCKKNPRRKHKLHSPRVVPLPGHPWKFYLAQSARFAGARRVVVVRHRRACIFTKHVLQLKGMMSPRKRHWYTPRPGTWLVRDFTCQNRSPGPGFAQKAVLPDSSKFDPQWINMLLGGTSGKCRAGKRRKLNQQAEGGEESLADGLLQFLDSWERKRPAGSTNEQPPKKTKRDTTVAVSPAGSLAQALSEVLRSCVASQQHDEVVAQKIKMSLSQWARSQKSGVKRVSWADESDQRPPKNHKVVAEPNRRFVVSPNTSCITDPPAKSYDCEFPKLKAPAKDAPKPVHGPPKVGNPFFAISPNEWTLAPKLTSVKAVQTALSNGETPGGNLVLAKSWDEVQSVRDLFQAFECTAPMTLLCDAQDCGLGGTLTKLSLKRCGSKNFKVETVHLWGIGAPGTNPWVRPAVNADIKKFQPATKVVLRFPRQNITGACIGLDPSQNLLRQF